MSGSGEGAAKRGMVPPRNDWSANPGIHVHVDGNGCLFIRMNRADCGWKDDEFVASNAMTATPRVSGLVVHVLIRIR